MSSVRPALRINHYSSAEVLARGWSIYQGMSSDPQSFPAPAPALSELKSELESLDLAEKAASPGTKSLIQTRNAVRGHVIAMLQSERAYVELRCNKLAPEDATTLIIKAGMFVVGPQQRSKPILAAKLGPVPGSIALDANAAALTDRQQRARVFRWQWTTDGGQSFHDAESTPVANTVITGLPALNVVGFRARASFADGSGAWSPIVTILVQ